MRPRWTLVSAPAASSWSPQGAGTWRLRLQANAAGVYRVNLVVTDGRGRTSREMQAVVRAR